MKRLLFIAAVVFTLGACGSGSAGGEGGSVNDGIHTNDRDGALQDTGGAPYTPGTDTAKGEHRVDVQERQ